MFRDKFRQKITQLGKKQTTIAQETGFTDSFVSRHINRDVDPDIIVFLRKFILTYRISPEYFYEMIVEKQFEGAKEKTNEMEREVETLRASVDSYKKIVEDLSSAMKFWAEERKKPD